MTHDRLILEERELHEAFRPLRPEPDLFRAEVERRIAERVAAGEGDAAGDGDERLGSVARAMERSPFLRAAAGLLPPGFLPGSLIGLTAKKLTWKAAPALFAMPAIALLMLVLTFAAALTQVVRLDSSAPRSPYLEREEIRRWWWSHRWVATSTLAGLAFFLWFRPGDALVGFLLASIGCLALILRRLSAAGFASRRSVGTKCARLLLSLGFYAALFGAQTPNGILHALPRSAAGILVVGALACTLAAWDGRPWRTWSEKGQGAVAALIALHALPIAALALAPLFRSPLGADGLREHVERRAIERIIDWPASAQAALWLRAKGVEVDLSRIAAYYADDERFVPGKDKVTLLELGLIAPEALVDLEQMAGWRRFEIPKELPLQRFQLTDDERIAALARSGEMTRVERETLLRRALATWPEDDAWMPLEVVSGLVRTLDELGAPEAFEPLVPRLHALLVRLWVGTHARHDGPAGFLPKQPWEYVASNATSTLDAVRLMVRFGVPDGVDLRRVRQYLEQAATQRFFWRSQLDPDQVVAATALDIVRERLPEPERGLLGMLFDRRVLVGVLLLVLFCCVATLRAPSSEALAPDESPRA